MTLLVVVVKNEAPRVVGLLSKFLVEVESGVWVGRVQRRVATELEASVVELGKGSAVFVSSSANEAGFCVSYVRSVRFGAVDNYGVPLILRRAPASADTDL